MGKKVQTHEELKVGDSSLSMGKDLLAHNGDILDSVVFIADNFLDFILWRKALESYVVQKTSVKKVYNFSQAIGKGSHGQVFLATPIYRHQ